jgi:hypothetical protein
MGWFRVHIFVYVEIFRQGERIVSVVRSLFFKKPSLFWNHRDTSTESVLSYLHAVSSLIQSSSVDTCMTLKNVVLTLCMRFGCVGRESGWRVIMATAAARALRGCYPGRLCRLGALPFVKSGPRASSAVSALCICSVLLYLHSESRRTDQSIHRCGAQYSGIFHWLNMVISLSCCTSNDLTLLRKPYFTAGYLNFPIWLILTGWKFYCSSD